MKLYYSSMGKKKSMDESALCQDDNDESAKYDNFDEKCCICGIFGRNNEI